VDAFGDLRDRARRAAAASRSPEAAIISELADALAAMAGRVDGLYAVISAVVTAAGAHMPPGEVPPPQLVQAMAGAHGRDTACVVPLGGTNWVIAVGPAAGDADPAAAWAALQEVVATVDSPAGKA